MIVLQSEKKPDNLKLKRTLQLIFILVLFFLSDNFYEKQALQVKKTQAKKKQTWQNSAEHNDLEMKNVVVILDSTRLESIRFSPK